MKTIPLYLISGFLGSGKTTFLKIILDRLGMKKRVGIIQNEYPISILDTDFLNQSNIEFSLMEANRLPGNNINLSEIFIEKLSDFILKESPQMIFFESSGLSDPYKTLQMLEDTKLKGVVYYSKSYILIDASRFEHEVTFLRSLRNHIRFADTILINKYDKLNRLESPQEITRSYNYKRVEKWLSGINPFAQILPTLFSQIPDYEVEYISTESSGIYNSSNYPEVKTFISDKRLSEKEISLLSKILEKSTKARGYIISSANKRYALNSFSGNFESVLYDHPLEKSELVVAGDKQIILELEHLL